MKTGGTSTRLKKGDVFPFEKVIEVPIAASQIDHDSYRVEAISSPGRSTVAVVWAVVGQ